MTTANASLESTPFNEDNLEERLIVALLLDTSSSIDDFGFWVGLEGAEKGTRTPRTGKGNFDLGHDAILLFVVC